MTLGGPDSGKIPISSYEISSQTADAGETSWDFTFYALRSNDSIKN